MQGTAAPFGPILLWLLTEIPTLKQILILTSALISASKSYNSDTKAESGFDPPSTPSSPDSSDSDLQWRSNSFTKEESRTNPSRNWACSCSGFLYKKKRNSVLNVNASHRRNLRLRPFGRRSWRPTSCFRRSILASGNKLEVAGSRNSDFLPFFAITMFNFILYINDMCF